ncbi:HlyD family secretion protein [Prolixibacter sp. NT017]|uniref:HlyD family secretion protein n=1 Tax=Prolixibacter sp. NT017 TaxID=2652390 RepID=UPI001298F698|nr:HlyD family efflux transporter periplasmic adaptor subunit [Prolixibacter sp. NT017]
MKQNIFPKEIIRFSLENHYFRFSRHSKAIYILLVGIVLVSLALLPFVMVDITVQSRGVIRSREEVTTIQSPITGQIEKVYIRENMKVSVGDTILRLAPEKISDQLQVIDDKIKLYSGYMTDIEGLLHSKKPQLQTDLMRSSYLEYRQKLMGYELRLETTRKDFQRTQLLYKKELIAAAEFEKKELELNQLLKERDFYISQKKADWQQKLFQYKIERKNLTNNRDQLAFEKRFYVVLAPANGYISNFQGIQTGSFILTNQTIASITPTDSLIAECYVGPEDIGYLNNGMVAAFQVDAYNYNQWGLAHGRIIDISNQPYQKDNAVYFKVRCLLNQEYLSLKSGYRGELKNGLTLTSRFKVTRRSLYDMLFDKADDWLNPKILTANNQN